MEQLTLFKTSHRHFIYLFTNSFVLPQNSPYSSKVCLLKWPRLPLSQSLTLKPRCCPTPFAVISHLCPHPVSASWYRRDPVWSKTPGVWIEGGTGSRTGWYWRGGEWCSWEVYLCVDSSQGFSQPSSTHWVTSWRAWVPGGSLPSCCSICLLNS